MTRNLQPGGITRRAAPIGLLAAAVLLLGACGDPVAGSASAAGSPGATMSSSPPAGGSGTTAPSPTTPATTSPSAVATTATTAAPTSSTRSTTRPTTAPPTTASSAAPAGSYADVDELLDAVDSGVERHSGATLRTVTDKPGEGDDSSCTILATYSGPWTENFSAECIGDEPGESSSFLQVDGTTWVSGLPDAPTRADGTPYRWSELDLEQGEDLELGGQNATALEFAMQSFKNLADGSAIWAYSPHVVDFAYAGTDNLTGGPAERYSMTVDALALAQSANPDVEGPPMTGYLDVWMHPADGLVKFRFAFSDGDREQVTGMEVDSFDDVALSAPAPEDVAPTG
ncbi:hypothetical protein GIS00_09525 [Nakamurella sp. YIM 132087]|uniref:LppP/LprE lipoprotein n=1 Tax=Nakamurella alba TaxID=2665158 RepID=A0A7K1FN28_9ACTN|nr:hypothetical protein [Nakamurella alba]MTD14184.1 hypothetical protein [Nakamurella alba]